ncbi:MAG TPA: hypothetical protein VGX23_30215 [Actinocrinis sp.]|nr:hypothetical protein [Actinocrinis sp.]
MLPVPVRCLLGANTTNATFRFHQIAVSLALVLVAGVCALEAADDLQDLLSPAHARPR